VQGSATNITIQASWNGATDVASWQALSGSSTSNLTPVGASVPNQGFQSTIHLSSSAGMVAVQALSASGAVLASSPVLSAP
ncbi:MAG: arylsulfotransferase family protein, partial [Solirubrobacteraceae bacterium]